MLRRGSAAAAAAAKEKRARTHTQTNPPPSPVPAAAGCRLRGGGGGGRRGCCQPAVGLASQFYATTYARSTHRRRTSREHVQQQQQQLRPKLRLYQGRGWINLFVSRFHHRICQLHWTINSKVTYLHCRYKYSLFRSCQDHLMNKLVLVPNR